MRKYLLPLLLVALIVCIRIPSFYEPHWYDDEEIYLAIGKSIHRGSQLYIDVTDNKPPLLYWWVSLHPSLIWIKLTALVCVVLSTFYLYAFTKSLQMPAVAQAVILTVFILLTNLPTFEGNIFNAELMFMPLIILSLYYTWAWVIQPKKNQSLTWDKLLMIGVLSGSASLIKVPAAVDFLTVLLASFFLSPVQMKNKISTLLKLCLGFMLPWVLISLYFVVNHSVAQFIYNSFMYNLKYVGDWAAISSSGLIHFLSPLWVRLLFLSLFISFAVILYRHRRIPSSLALIFIWLGCSWFGSLLSLRPYPHYLLQLAAPLSVLIGFITITPQLKIRLTLAAVVCGVYLYIHFVPFIPYRTQSYYQNWWKYVTHQVSAEQFSNWFNGKAESAGHLSQFLNSHSDHQDKLFVWGNIAAVYAQANLSPATPYLTDYLVNSYQAYSSIEQSFTSSPPQWIVYCPSAALHFPALDSLIDRSYFKITQAPPCDLYHYWPLRMLQ